MTRFADRILASAIRLMPDTDKDWANAMHSELAHIDNDRAALSFAIGCYRAAWKRKLKTEHYEPLARGFVVSCIALWVLAKLYLGLGGTFAQAGFATGWMDAAAWERIGISVWQMGLISLAGLGYVGTAFCLLTRRWFALSACLITVIMLNSAFFMTVAGGGYAYAYSDRSLTFFLAVIAEEYFILTATLVGAFALYWWPKVMAGERPWRTT